MRFFQEIAMNHVLLVGVVCWFVAQALKVVFYLIIAQKLDFSRFFGLGGMPSSHSSVVCGLATSVGLLKGFYSPEFAISFVLAGVVMTDAAGVRRAAGKQAAVLNQLIAEIFDPNQGLNYGKLKELLGHSPFEVLIGALIGVLIGFLMM